MTTPMRPTTAYSEYFRMMTRVEHMHMAITLERRKRWVMPHGTATLIQHIFQRRLLREER